MRLLGRENIGLLVIDVQEKLMPVIEQNQRMIGNIIKLLHLSEYFTLPVFLTEQYPKWLGHTIPEIKGSLPGYEPIVKMHFDCCEADGFKELLNSAGIDHLIVTGVESHICVFQTCVSLVMAGYHIHIPQDGVGSRTDENWRVGLELMNKAGAVITSTETIIYQILKKAGTKEFKKMLKLLK